MTMQNHSMTFYLATTRNSALLHQPWNTTSWLTLTQGVNEPVELGIPVVVFRGSQRVSHTLHTVHNGASEVVRWVNPERTHAFKSTNVLLTQASQMFTGTRVSNSGGKYLPDRDVKLNKWLSVVQIFPRTYLYLSPVRTCGSGLQR